MDDLLKAYFLRGYRYRVILCFLFGLHGIKMSLSTLKRKLKKLGLSRRSGCSDTHLRNCVEVSCSVIYLHSSVLK